MNSANDPLAQLRDIHLPDPISWWPPAPGWWVLAVVVLALLFFMTRKVRHTVQYHVSQGKYRNEAIDAIEHCFQTYRDRHKQNKDSHVKQNKDSHVMQQDQDLEQDSHTLSQDVLGILRRCALTVGYGDDVTSQSAGQLLHKLDQHATDPIFGDDLAQRLEQLAYAPDPEPLSDEECNELERCAITWIKTHTADTTEATV